MNRKRNWKISKNCRNYSFPSENVSYQIDTRLQTDSFWIQENFNEYPIVTETNQLSLSLLSPCKSFPALTRGFTQVLTDARGRNVNFGDETRLKQRVWLLWQFYPILCILSTGVFLVWIEGKWSLITKLLLNTLCFYFVKTQT